MYKFRGKRVDNGEWVEGYIMCQDGLMDFEIKHYIHSAKPAKAKGNSKYPDIPVLVGNKRFEVIPETVGMWTGLVDKNGAEIYQGDKVVIYGGVHEVIYDKYMFNLKDFYCSSFDYPCDAFSEGLGSIEVIGTTHDSPLPLDEKSNKG